MRFVLFICFFFLSSSSFSSPPIAKKGFHEKGKFDMKEMHVHMCVSVHVMVMVWRRERVG